MNFYQRILSHLDELHDHLPVAKSPFRPRFDRTVSTDSIELSETATTPPAAMTTMETPLTSINSEVHANLTTSEDATDRMIANAIRAAGVYDTPQQKTPINSAIVESTSPSVDTETMDSVKQTQGTAGQPELGTGALQMGRVFLELDLTPDQTTQLFAATLATKQAILTLEEVAEMLRLECHEVAQLTRQGNLPGFIAGANLRYRRTDVAAWVETQLTTMSRETAQHTHAA